MPPQRTIIVMRARRTNSWPPVRVPQPLGRLAALIAASWSLQHRPSRNSLLPQALIFRSNLLHSASTVWECRTDIYLHRSLSARLLQAQAFRRFGFSPLASPV